MTDTCCMGHIGHEQLKIQHQELIVEMHVPENGSGDIWQQFKAHSSSSSEASNSLIYASEAIQGLSWFSQPTSDCLVSVGWVCLFWGNMHAHGKKGCSSFACVECFWHTPSAFALFSQSNIMPYTQEPTPQHYSTVGWYILNRSMACALTYTRSWVSQLSVRLLQKSSAQSSKSCIILE